MYSNRDISISTSSGRSASPNRAVAKRQEDEKAHRKTTKGDSEKKKTSGGGGKRSGDSRQKKANEAKDQGKQSRRPRPK